MTAPRKAICPEDDDFMAALDRMVAENIHDRGKEVTKPPAVDIAIPWQVKASLKKPYGESLSYPSLYRSLKTDGSFYSIWQMEVTRITWAILSVGSLEEL